MMDFPLVLVQMKAESSTFLTVRQDNSTDSVPPKPPAGLAMTASNRKTTHDTQRHTCMKMHESRWEKRENTLEKTATGEACRTVDHAVMEERRGENI